MKNPDSVEENVRSRLELISARDSRIGAFIEVYAEDAIAQARDIDARMKAGKKVGSLAGLVVGIKNSIAVRGKRLTCASKMLENYAAPYSATAVERIIAEDGVIIGSTNLDEFSCGSDCSRSKLAKTVNPLDFERVPGGSSGGSAAAVAAGFCDVTLSEDTGGSIRLPAAFCGAVGVKPTYGAVSRYGICDLAMSFDQLGPLGRDVGSCARLLSTVMGEDGRDAMTAGVARVDYSAHLNSFPKRLRVGVPKEFFSGCDEWVSEAVWGKIKALESARDGVEIREFSFPILKYALPIYYILCASEFSSAMQKYDGLKYGMPWSEANGRDLNEIVSTVRDRALGAEVKRRILIGTYVTTKEFRDAWYSKALKARDALKKEFARVFDDFDAVMGPTAPMVAWKLGEKDQDPLQMYLADILAVPANCAGLPAASVPAGRTKKENMPAGLQVIAPWGGEQALLQILRACEK
ncbi:Asp-tRNA(Asn)/Glu-tRNA(Gln) amidotransferase subunit GatA [Candidatus Micrarchaeota archaeon]|nr:Asp-tRNA(Asn)/Glu-tRNA(Gln) amidotransferase subunit GatA [Candidatus Micrarchaeota archaeon]